MRKSFEFDNYFCFKRATPLERAHETERNDLFQASLGCISQEIQSNSDRIAPALARSVVLMSKHYLSKAFIQLQRNIEDHGTPHFTPYFGFFFILKSIFYRESPQNWRLLFCSHIIGEKHKISPGSHNYER